MKYIKIKEIVEIYLGLTHTPKYVNEGIPFLSVKDISKGKIDFSQCHYISEEEYKKLPQGAKPQKGDMLFCRVGTIGKPLIIEENVEKFGSFVSLGFFRIKNSKYLLKYLKYWMDSDFFYTQVKKNVKGVAQINLNTSWLKEFIIPINNINKQVEIVKKLDKVQELININKEQINLLDELINSKFIEMFGNPILNDKNWMEDYIENLTTKSKNSIKAGPFGSSLKKDCYTQCGYKIYGQEQVINQDINYGNYYISEDKYKELENYAIKENDILISLVGSYGKILIIPKIFVPGIINPRLMKITFDLNKINPIFFKVLFYLEEFKQIIEKKTHGGTMGILNVGIIKNIKIYLPTIELQNQFANIVEKIEKQKEQYKKNIEKAQELMNTLMNKYFN